MPTSIKYPTSVNCTQKTLDSALTAGVTASVTLNSVTGIQNKAGVFVVDRVDSNGTATPSKREYIAFTGVSGSTLTTLTRNADGGGSDQDHAVGAVVEFVSDVLQQQAIIDGLLNTTTTAGALDTTKVVDLTTAQTLTNKTLTSPKLNENVALTSTSTELNLLSGSTSLVTPTSTNTLTNKRIEPRIVTEANYTTDTGTSLSVATADIFQVTAQAGALKLNNPGGTPVAGQKLIIRVKDDGTARALTYDTQFRASTDLPLPSTTILGKTMYMGFIYSVTDTKWDLLAYLDNI